jgi:hypothetical protein
MGLIRTLGRVIPGGRCDPGDLPRAENTSPSFSTELSICRNSRFPSWLVNAVKGCDFDFEKFE